MSWLDGALEAERPRAPRRSSRRRTSRSVPSRSRRNLSSGGGNGDASVSRGVGQNINAAKRRAPLLGKISAGPSPAVAAARGERAGPRARVRRRGSGIDRRVKRGSRTHLPQEVGPGRRDRARILAPLVLEGLEVRGARAADELVLHLAVRGWRRMASGQDRGRMPSRETCGSPPWSPGSTGSARPTEPSRTRPSIRRWRPWKS